MPRDLNHADQATRTLKFRGKGLVPIGAALRRFGRQDDGALMIFALVLFMLMAMMGGLAVDLMRYESTRTTLQNTLDRSTLAAASLSNTLDPEAVVYDYFDKAGMRGYLTSVTVNNGINYREVVADARADSEPMFLHMFGINDFDAPGHSKAEQRISNVEIMLVLDVSGSMASNSKLVNLKTAANEFVNSVLSSDVDQRISIGIVPFNGQVNLGSTLISKFNATFDPGIADENCIDLPSGVYATAAMSRTLSLPKTTNADTYSGSYTSGGYSTSYMTPLQTNVWCPARPGNIVRMPSQTIATLPANITGLNAVGAASINAGLKWGLSLLDPDARGMYAELIASSDMAAPLAGRPYEFTDPEALKVIVLMTDGEHFGEERAADAYKSGPSPI